LEQIQEMGQRATVIQADLSSVEACFELVDQAVDFLGGIDIMMNNAGITVSGDFLEVTPEQFDLLYNVNVRGEFFCAQRAVKHMLERDEPGVVINMTSVHAFAGIPGHSIYAGTKGALRSWTRELAVELAPLGVRVNGIAPGWVAVESHFAQIPNFDPEAYGELIPYGRLGIPEDVAKACVFLASEESDFMVGHVMLLDGGTTAKMALSMDQVGEFRDADTESEVMDE
jgi:NAD(P)-dependent dehydrogenase (short-subunit alcohol dehydrogenase family)